MRASAPNGKKVEARQSRRVGIEKKEQEKGQALVEKEGSGLAPLWQGRRSWGGRCRQPERGKRLTSARREQDKGNGGARWSVYGVVQELGR